MTWFFAILIVLATGVVAVVAAGRGGSMAEVYDDRPDARVPAEGPLTARDVREVRFTTAFRGYRMSEVDTLLARLADEIAVAEEARAAEEVDAEAEAEVGRPAAEVAEARAAEEVAAAEERDEPPGVAPRTAPRRGGGGGRD